MSIITKERGGSEVEIYASGVVDLSSGTLNCNQEDLLGTMNQTVNEMNPDRDWYGKYMAKHNYAPPCLDGLLDEIMRQPQKKSKPEYLKNMEADFVPWQPPKKQCIWCGEKFIPKRMDQKYCGANCQYESAKKRQQDQALRGKVQRYCVACGAPLPLSISSRILTCSKACSEEHKKAYFKAKNKREYQKRRQKAMEKGD